MAMDILFVMAGVVLLYLGGEGLVRGASMLGRQLGMSPLVVGLTIVSLGTSAPELAASLAAALRGSPAIALGNVVGSNIANLGLVLGLTALLWPLRTSARFLLRDVGAMLGATLLLFFAVQGEMVSRFDGLVLLALIVAYLVFLLHDEKGEEEATGTEFQTEYGALPTGTGWSVLYVAAGIGLLVAGANLLVAGAVGLAISLGVSERVVGLTVVAFGTSLPELASSLVAAAKRQPGIVLGNLIGSNIFNILFILGTTAVVTPVAAPWAEIRVDLLVLLAVSVLTPIFLLTGERINRWEGALLLGGYGLYVATLFR